MNANPVLVAILLASPVAAQTPAFADLARIDRAVAEFTGAAQGQPGGATLPVDRRLRLTPCQAPIALEWNGPRRDSVVVRCPEPGSWRLFVPVNAAGTQGSQAPAILRGEAVTIAISGEGFSVSQPGEALESGAVGSWIRVRTTSAGMARGEPKRARVVQPGVVSIPLP